MGMKMWSFEANLILIGLRNSQCFPISIQIQREKKYHLNVVPIFCCHWWECCTSLSSIRWDRLCFCSKTLKALSFNAMCQRIVGAFVSLQVSTKKLSKHFCFFAFCFLHFCLLVGLFFPHITSLR